MNELHYERGINVAGKALSRAHIAVHRLTQGRLGRHWNGRDVAFITTTGRRTGRPHTTPLACIHHRDGVAVVASNGGGDPPPPRGLAPQPDTRAGQDRRGRTSTRPAPPAP